MAHAVIKKGDRVVLTNLARWRNLGLGLRAGMRGTVRDITKTTYSFGGRTPSKYWPHFTTPEKRYWVKLDKPTPKMTKKRIDTLGFFYDRLNGREIKKA